jgi:hypothetical protein
MTHEQAIELIRLTESFVERNKQHYETRKKQWKP